MMVKIKFWLIALPQSWKTVQYGQGGISWYIHFSNFGNAHKHKNNNHICTNWLYSSDFVYLILL